MPLWLLSKECKPDLSVDARRFSMNQAGLRPAGQPGKIYVALIIGVEAGDKARQHATVRHAQASKQSVSACLSMDAASKPRAGKQCKHTVHKGWPTVGLHLLLTPGLPSL